MGSAEAVWIALGGNAAFLVALAFLGRSIVHQWLEKDLEGFKQRLESASALELEQVRSRNAEQLELARHRLESILRQNSKLHDKEFTALADIWEKLNEALGHVARLVALFQQYPDLDRMEEPKFRAFVSTCAFDDTDRAELLRTKHRNEFYQKRIVWYRIRDAKNECTLLHREIQRNSIFLDPEIRQRFLKIDELMWSALISREVGQEAGDIKLWRDAASQLSNDIAPLKAEIEGLLQKRLGYKAGNIPDAAVF